MKKKILLGFVCLMFSLFFVPNVRAEGDEDNVLFTTTAVVTKDKIVAKNHILQNKDINGDLYFAGNNATINGSVSGDIIGAATNININGNVKNSIRVAGNSITLDNVTANSLTIAGSSVTLSNINANNVYVVASDFDFDGVINTLYLGGKEVIINGTISGKSTIYADKVTIGDNAKITGELTVKSPHKITYDGVSPTSTNIKYVKIHEKYLYSFEGSIVGFVIRVISMTLFAYLLMLLFSNFINKSINQLKSEKATPILWGWLWLVVTPLLIILAFMTVVGIPIAIVTIFTYIILLIISSAFSSLALGNILFKDMNKYLATFIAVLIISALGFIPVVNFFVWLICTGYTFGSMKLILNNNKS